MPPFVMVFCSCYKQEGKNICGEVRCTFCSLSLPHRGFKMSGIYYHIGEETSENTFDSLHTALLFS